MGNLGSVAKAIAFLGHECRIQPDLQGATRLIIPGVGAFGAAMARLAPLREAIRDLALVQRVPVLGICLGQQLLFTESEEFGRHEGLGLVPGRVRYFPPTPGLKVPHMGWNALSQVNPTGPLASTQPGDQVYFVHSLYTECEDPAHVAGVSVHGLPFAAAVGAGNVWGCQFHPEKSGAVGLRILESFLS